MSEHSGMMQELAAKLRVSVDPHDMERALIIDTMRRSRGCDVPFSPPAEPLEAVPVHDSHDPMLVAEVVGTIAAYPDDEPLTRADLQTSVPIGKTALIKTLGALKSSGLIADGPEVPNEEAGKPGKPPLSIIKTRWFDDIVEKNPAWRRAAQIRELMQLTGKTRGEAVDYALALCKESILAYREDQEKTA